MINATIQSEQQNSLVNQANSTGLPQSILQAIKNAAARTGVDFSYLVKKASQESGFDPNAKASTSSATGLYQFTQQTWMQMVKSYGSEYGLSDYASHISTDSSGALHADKGWKQAILGLRTNPQLSAEMAGELDKENMSSLQQNVSGKVGGTELYLAHFLGAGGASDFLNEMHANPNATAANVLPEAAAANPSVFYNASGEARTLKQIYQHFAQKFDQSPSTVMVASTAPASSSNVSSRAATQAYTVADASTGSYVPNTASVSKPVTSSLFATMVIAQSDMADLALSGMDKAKSDEHKKSTDNSEFIG